MQNRRLQAFSIKNFFDEAAARVRGFGRRIAVHCFAAISGGLAASSPPIPGHDKGFGIFFATYIGLVCLFSREMALKASWLLPFGSGVLQWSFLLFGGFPFYAAVLFGGLQTWVQRIIQKRGKNGTEWFAAFFLFLSVQALFPHLNGLPIAVSFSLILLGGVLIAKRYQSDEFRNIHVKAFRKSLAQLESAGFSNKLTFQIRELSEELLKTARKHEKSLIKNSAEEIAVMESIRNAAERLGEHLREDTSMESSGSSEKETGAVLEQALSRLDSLLETRKKEEAENTDQKKQEKIKQDILLKTRPFRESAAELLRKKDKLPDDLHGYVEKIHLSALAILECMASDPKDVDAGTRFLDRYLPAAHRVLDERLRLSQAGPASSELEKTLSLSTELLDRLEKAFAREHAALMQNDLIHFTAEMKVLDSLLKMDGR